MSKSQSNETERLAAMFKALSNPQRLRLFIRLMTCCPVGECPCVSPAGMRRCVGDLGKDLGVAASTVSHHLKELRVAGLMQVERRGKMIECWVNEDAVRQLAAFFIETRGLAACESEEATGTGGRNGIEVR